MYSFQINIDLTLLSKHKIRNREKFDSSQVKFSKKFINMIQWYSFFINSPFQ